MFAFEKHSTPGAGYTGTVSLKCSFCVQHRIDIFVRLDLRGSAPLLHITTLTTDCNLCKIRTFLAIWMRIILTAGDQCVAGFGLWWRVGRNIPHPIDQMVVPKCYSAPLSCVASLYGEQVSKRNLYSASKSATDIGVAPRRNKYAFSFV